MDLKQDVVKIQKGLKTLGILTLVGVGIRFVLLVLALIYQMDTAIIGGHPCEIILSENFKPFLHLVLTILLVILGVRMVKGKIVGIKKYILLTMVLLVSLTLWSLYLHLTSISYAFGLARFRPIVINLIFLLEMILPIISLVFVNKGMKNQEYVKMLPKESKLGKIFSVIFFVLVVIGFVYYLYGDFESIRLSKECWKESESVRLM